MICAIFMICIPLLSVTFVMCILTGEIKTFIIIIIIIIIIIKTSTTISPFRKISHLQVPFLFLFLFIYLFIFFHVRAFSVQRTRLSWNLEQSTFKSTESSFI